MNSSGREQTGRKTTPGSGQSWRNTYAGPILSRFVRLNHYLLIAVVLTGWLHADISWLKAYAVLLPLMVIHWRFNDDACILTNLEYWLTHDPATRPNVRDQEPFIGKLLTRLYGGPVTLLTIQIWAHAMVILVWLLGLAHLQQLGGW